MIDLPAPPVPPDLDLTSLSYMPLVIARLKDSALKRKASPAGFRAAVLLWMAAWWEVPAASLPNDEAELRDIAGYGPGSEEAWAAIRDEALRGFSLCSDGRLYHAFLADRAIEAGAKIRKGRDRTAAATAARLAKRNGQRNERPERNETTKATSQPIYNVRDDDDTSVVTDTKRSEVKRSEDNRPCSVNSLPREETSRLTSRTFRAPDDDPLLRALCTAAGDMLGSSPNLFVTGPIEHLIGTGEVTLEDDVLPVIREKAQAGKVAAGALNSWKLFIADIRAHAARRKSQDAKSGAGKTLTIEEIMGAQS